MPFRIGLFFLEERLLLFLNDVTALAATNRQEIFAPAPSNVVLGPHFTPTFELKDAAQITDQEEARPAAALQVTLVNTHGHQASDDSHAYCIPMALCLPALVIVCFQIRSRGSSSPRDLYSSVSSEGQGRKPSRRAHGGMTLSAGESTNMW